MFFSFLNLNIVSSLHTRDLMLFNQFTIEELSSLCITLSPAFLALEFNTSAINVDDALVQRAVESLGDIWSRGKEDGEFCRGAESAMRATANGGDFTNSSRVFRQNAPEDGHARPLYAEQPRRAVIVASTLSYFPSFARTVSAWLWVVREHIRMRVHVPLDVTLAQSSSIARQLAATGASRGSSRSSSKAGPLVVQHPRPRQIHVFIHTPPRSVTIHFPPVLPPLPRRHLLDESLSAIT